MVGEEMIFNPTTMAAGGGAFAGLLGLFMAFLVVFLIIFVIVYVYAAFALMVIAKKTKTEPSWLAWIPIGNLYLLSKIAKMHWWPILLIIGCVIPILNVLCGIALSIFVTIWLWKMFEAVKRPGWWSLLAWIPFLGGLIELILFGIAAWGSTTTTKA